jgi:hypothetical protein
VLVRRVLAAVVGLVCVGLLSSCALLPPGSSGDEQQHAEIQMRHIADAVKSHDSAALKTLFSPTAREKATDLDGGLKYFLSVFPAGLKSWTIENGAPGSAEENEGGYREELYAFYKVLANGKTYTVYFADLTVNSNDPKNIGIYALAVGPYNANPATSPTAASDAFYVWAGSHQLENGKLTGTPGVYVPQK